MTTTRLTFDRDSCHKAWAAFVRHDAALTAPPELAARVLASVAARPPARALHVQPPAAASWPALAGIAAVLVAALAAGAGFIWQARRNDGAQVVSIPTSGTPRWATHPATVTADVPARLVPKTRTRDRAEPRPARAANGTAAATSRTGVADADGPSEALQVIRVRIDASSLETFGVQVAGPMPAGLVDVDLVVGDDGWPRDVRRIRPVVAVGPPE
jgi:hypothetical protein